MGGEGAWDQRVYYRKRPKRLRPGVWPGGGAWQGSPGSWRWL